MLTRSIVGLLALTVAVSASAQTARGRSAAEPFESYLTVADILGKPLSETQRVWPWSANRSGETDELQLTGAIRIALRGDAPAARAAGDTARLVSSVVYTEVVRDTASLVARTALIMLRLQERFGPPQLCAGPMGSIGALFAPQQGTRSWTRGINSMRTQLDWTVLPGTPLTITVRAGQYIAAPEFERRCDVKLP